MKLTPKKVKAAAPSIRPTKEPSTNGQHPTLGSSSRQFAGEARKNI